MPTISLITEPSLFIGTVSVILKITSQNIQSHLLGGGGWGKLSLGNEEMSPEGTGETTK